MKTFVKSSRVHFTCDKQLRIVYVSDVIKEVANAKLSDYIAEKVPYLYRRLDKIIDSFSDGYFFHALKETLAKIPTAESFQSSHFGEIAACLFAEEVIGLKRIYSKLTLNTSENQNALKMDLLFYKPNSNPVEFYFGEVKSSPKDQDDGLPPEHDKSCYPSLFNSLREYSDSDLQFDLTAVKDNLDNLPEAEREPLRQALLPYGNRKVNYIGFVVIDSSTKDDKEIPVLGTRKNAKDFEVDLICIEGYKEISTNTYKKIETIKNSL